MGLTAGYDIDQKMQEWRINGFVVFEDMIPHEKIDRIREAWIPVRDRDIERQGDHPFRGFRRYNVRVPFTRPFVDPEIFEHPALVAFMERALGPDYVWSHFDSNIPLPGTDYQTWHRDGQVALYPGIKTPALAVGVKFPLVDTNERTAVSRCFLARSISGTKTCWTTWTTFSAPAKTGSVPTIPRV